MCPFQGVVRRFRIASYEHASQEHHIVRACAGPGGAFRRVVFLGLIDGPGKTWTTSERVVLVKGCEIYLNGNVDHSPVS